MSSFGFGPSNPWDMLTLHQREEIMKYEARTDKQHDDSCEAEYVAGANAYTECECEERRKSNG